MMGRTLSRDETTAFDDSNRRVAVIKHFDGDAIGVVDTRSERAPVVVPHCEGHLPELASESSVSQSPGHSDGTSYPTLKWENSSHHSSFLNGVAVLTQSPWLNSVRNYFRKANHRLLSITN